MGFGYRLEVLATPAGEVQAYVCIREGTLRLCEMPAMSFVSVSRLTVNQCQRVKHDDITMTYEY